MAPPSSGVTQTIFVRPAKAVVSASSLYPLKVSSPRLLYFLLSSSSLTLFEQGLFYFVAHPFLYPLLRARLLPAFLLSIFVLGNLFFWTYLPQVAFLAIFHYAGAWLNGTFLVLGEGAAIVAILFEAFFVVLCPTLALDRFSTADTIERTSLSSTSLTPYSWKRGLRTLSLREGRLL